MKLIEFAFTVYCLYCVPLSLPNQCNCDQQIFDSISFPSPASAPSSHISSSPSSPPSLSNPFISNTSLPNNAALLVDSILTNKANLQNYKRFSENVLKKLIHKSSISDTRPLQPLSSGNPPKTQTINRTVEEKWLIGAGFVNDLMLSAIKESLPLLLQLAYKVHLSPPCASSLVRLLAGIRAHKEWAYSIIDANGRPPAGIISGTLTDLGDYDQCININVYNEKEVGDEEGKQQPLSFRGKYCLLKLIPSLPAPRPTGLRISDTIIHLNGTTLQGTLFHKIARLAHGFYSLPYYNGLCIPSTCRAIEIEQIIQSLIDPVYLHAKLDESTCDIKEDTITLAPHQIFALSSLTFMLLLVISSTIYTSRTKLSLEKAALASSCGSSTTICNVTLNELINCFSLTSNTSNLFNCSKKGEKRLLFIHGTRVFTMLWIIVCHTYTLGTQFITPIVNNRIEAEARPMGRQLSMQFIINGWFSVETFFFLSGMVVIYVGLPIVEERKGKVSFLSFLFIRWLRFTPSLIALLLVHYLWPLLGSGPVFKQWSTALIAPCLSSWWKNLLYINNFASHHNDICLKHTWYLSADFQFHVSVYFLLQLFYFYPSIGKLLNLSLITLGILIPATIVFANNLPPTLIINTPYIDKFEEYFAYFYFPTYNHIAPYFIGVFVGYLFLKHKQIHISQMTRTALWTVLPFTSVAIILTTYIWNGLERECDRLTATLYAGLHRFVWTCGIAWLAIACAYGYGGLATRCLSWKCWIPLSRLSYTIYLVHFLVIYFHYLTHRKPIAFLHYEMIYTSCGTVIFSIFFAFFLHLLVEAPFANLMKLFLTQRKKGLNEGGKDGADDGTDEQRNNCQIVHVLTVEHLQKMNGKGAKREEGEEDGEKGEKKVNNLNNSQIHSSNV